MISLLGSEIGRGHPFYLDGLRDALRAAGREDVIARDTDVFRVSRGLSRLAWAGARSAYRLAGRGGVVAAAYHRLRGGADHDRDSSALRLLGRDLRAWAGPDGVVVVDHPSVAGALGDRADTWYLHGEMVAPPEAMVRRAARIFVPLPETAAEFVRGGVAESRLVVTGLCVERPPREDAERRLAERCARLAGSGPLTVAFFSSGAEPVAHVAALSTAAVALAGTHRAVVFAQKGGRLERALARAPGRAEVLTYRGRAELDALTARHFGSFDAVVSPPHERSNWAVGLGLPFFLVGPDIGPFAPRNRALLLGRGVARALDDRTFPSTLEELRRTGELERMAGRGAAERVDGFDRAAEALIAESERGRDAR